MRLKSRNNFPPNGWMFYQAETGWSSDPWFSFEETVSSMITHRSANPRFNLSTDRGAVGNELEQYTVARLSSMNGMGEYLLDDGNAPPSSFLSRHPLRERIAAGAVRARNLVVGFKVIKDWLGDGLVPVEQVVAERRAIVCAACPNNQPGNIFVEAAGETVKRLLEVKTEMALTTFKDAELKSCTACGCVNSLKVWSNLPHILAHTTEEVRSKLHPDCWILKPNS